ncbi:MAG: GatB/YqeY domain-containing protein [Bacteroidota bacterium]|nr:GatB/YqeY domain-containing protein [Bacteroidota bacterium]
MSLEEKINADIKAAMLSKQEAALRALRAVKSAILLAKTSGGSGALSEDDEMKLLQKLVKQRRESVEIFDKQGREDLSKGEKEEIAVIEKFLPAQLDEAAIRVEVKNIIASVGASSPSDTGKVMGAASKAFAGKADNKLVASIVKELLSGQ